MHSHTRLLGLVASISASLLQICSLCGQSPPTPAPTDSAVSKATVTVSYGGGQSVVTTKTQQGLSKRIGLQPSQIVDVALQLSPAKAGHTIALEPLDGGRLIGASKTRVVASDGTIAFKFRPGSRPGISQILVRDGAQEIGLQFWVLDPQNPQVNPPVLTPTTSNL